MNRFLASFLLILIASVTSLFALPEEESRPITGEMEEGLEQQVETAVPWHDSLLELPMWISQEVTQIEQRTRPANQGAGLFPTEIWPLQPEPLLGPLIWDDALAASDRVKMARSHFPSPLALNPEVMALYTDKKPDRVFVDPQHLIPGDRVELLVQRWLNEQCVFRTTVLLFGAGQQLPAGFDPQALRREWFGESGEELLVFYFYQEPQRTLAIFGPEAKARYGADLLRTVVDAAVTEAGRVEGAPEQLDRFCYKMSVRLHWLARTAPVSIVSERQLSALTQSSGNLQKASLAALIGAGLIACSLLIMKWYRRRISHPKTTECSFSVLLPEYECHPRFGAPHSGGFSSMITFAKSPP